jgi:hypothetical protein
MKVLVGGSILSVGCWWAVSGFHEAVGKVLVGVSRVSVGCQWVS